MDSLYKEHQDIPLWMVVVKLRVKQELPDLVERQEAVSGNM